MMEISVLDDPSDKNKKLLRLQFDDSQNPGEFIAIVLPYNIDDPDILFPTMLRHLAKRLDSEFTNDHAKEIEK